MYGRKSDAIVAYSFAADTYCPEHLIEFMVTNGYASPAARDMDVETVLNQIAGAEGIDREDERSFDSGDFPKVVLAVDLIEGETCGWERGHEID